MGPEYPFEWELGESTMRLLAYAFALAFAVGTMSLAHACPKMFESASTTSTVASADEQGAPPSTKIRVPSPKG